MRLDRFLSEMGLGTRSEIKKAAKAGQIAVDGAVEKDSGRRIDPGAAVTYRGFPVIYEEYVYYLMNKPAGIISASDDSREATVVDLIETPRRKDIFPVGRLDRDTEGLLLISNDGSLAHRLLAPGHHVDKVYYAVVRGILSDSDTAAFGKGLELPDGLRCLPAELSILSSDSVREQSEAEITIREGKFHQIKRMFLAVGKEVLYLKRLSMGPLKLDPELQPGEYRKLTEAELEALSDL